MKNAWNRKVRIRTARQNATISSSGSSCHRGMFLRIRRARCRQASPAGSSATCLPLRTSKLPEYATTAQGDQLRAVAGNAGATNVTPSVAPPTLSARVDLPMRFGDPRRTRLPAAFGSTGRALALLLDLGLLAAQVTQVVELGAAHVAPGHDLDPVQRRAVDREGPLDPDPEADLANREGLPQAGTLAPDDDAVEDLDPGTVALDDPCMDLERVAGAEIRDVGPLRLGVQGVQRVHRCCFLGAQGVPRRARPRRWSTG